MHVSVQMCASVCGCMDGRSTCDYIMFTVQCEDT